MKSKFYLRIKQQSPAKGKVNAKCGHIKDFIFNEKCFVSLKSSYSNACDLTNLCYIFTKLFTCLSIFSLWFLKTFILKIMMGVCKSKIIYYSIMQWKWIYETTYQSLNYHLLNKRQHAILRERQELGIKPDVKGFCRYIKLSSSLSKHRKDN